MSNYLTTIFAKAVKKAAAVRGGGSALPGLVIERIDPNFISRSLAGLPHGVVVISGTNGKTTTTKMVVELLESQGLKVFTNRTGSNFTRGVASALISEINMKGELESDIAVLELDEAHAVHFVDKIPPRYSLLLNVMRDQLDRFGEIDATARLLRHIASATTGAVVLNREDPRVRKIGEDERSHEVVYFGLSEQTRPLFPDDDSMRGGTIPAAKLPSAAVTLDHLAGQTARFTVGDKPFETTLKLQGIYNIYNAAAALALVRHILGDTANTSKLMDCLSEIQPAFGRGERLIVGGQPLELVLVKNPSGFRLGLSSFTPEGYATMIAINDNYADGRDMSWLWDVDFHSLAPLGVRMVSGIRAFDMALRLQYEDVEIEQVEPSLAKALRAFIDAHASQPKRIYCTYTAMLALRRELAKITNVEAIS